MCKSSLLHFAHNTWDWNFTYNSYGLNFKPIVNQSFVKNFILAASLVLLTWKVANKYLNKYFYLWHFEISGGGSINVFAAPQTYPACSNIKPLILAHLSTKCCALEYSRSWSLFQFQFRCGKTSTIRDFLWIFLTIRLFVSKLGNVRILITCLFIFFHQYFSSGWPSTRAMWLCWNKIFHVFLGFHFLKLIILIYFSSFCSSWQSFVEYS